MNSVFFALIHRLRSTPRWSGMVATQPEDVAQHSFGVALIAHALCIIDEEIFHRRPDVGRVLAAALLHDAAESILTDVIAPVKKYSPDVESAFKKLEGLAEAQIVETLPPVLQEKYRDAMARQDTEVSEYVHAADKLDALCKCKLELRRGNQEFAIAAKQIEDGLRAHASPCVAYFLDTFVPAFDRSVDEYRYLQAETE
jgi:5'-deoxynucleotidase